MSTDKFYTLLITTLNRVFSGCFDSDGVKPKGWYLSGGSLAYFVANGTLTGCKDIEVTVAGSTDTLGTILYSRGLKPVDCNAVRDIYEFIGGGRLYINKIKDIGTIVHEFPSDYDRAKLNFPAKLGKVLDAWKPDWSENKHKRVYPVNCFFTELRRKNGHDFIKKMLECGERAGIRDRMFLGFGNALGYAVFGDFIPKDDDIDMVIQADGIPQEQRFKYLSECKKAGLCESRMRGPVSIEGKYLWFSIGPKSPYNEEGVKSCNWFHFKYGGYWWHSKGANWIGRKDLNSKYPTAKGIPVSVFDGELKTVNFGGNQVQIPKKLGAYLDWCYPEWILRKSEASKIRSILVIPKDDRKTWYIEKR